MEKEARQKRQEVGKENEEEIEREEEMAKKRNLVKVMLIPP